jgi:hypothetical protein
VAAIAERQPPADEANREVVGAGTPGSLEHNLMRPAAVDGGFAKISSALDHAGTSHSRRPRSRGEDKTGSVAELAGGSMRVSELEQKREHKTVEASADRTGGIGGSRKSQDGGVRAASLAGLYGRRTG